MASLLLTACLLFSATALVKADDEITWGSVLFTYHGEKIPLLHEGPYKLTPLGANQLLQAGQTVRERYLSTSSNGSVPMLINGLSTNDIDNEQIEILTMTDEFITASALAFMQGLYPPRSTITNILDNGTLEQFPLNGYQYPNVQSTSTLDYNYIWLAGNIQCTNLSIQHLDTLVSSEFVSKSVANEDFYGNFTTTVFSDLKPDIVNYGNAWDIYEYALYEYSHNQTVYDSLAPSDLAKLYELASEQQWSLNTGAPNSAAYINSISGQTMGSKIVQQLAQNIASGGVSNKLTLMFGSYEPFLAFFALSALNKGHSGAAFKSLPQHGSVLAFDLFSDPTNPSGQNLSQEFPNTEDLMVRFSFRNGTGDMLQYPLFGRGNSELDMSWTDFVSGMSGFALNTIAEWCTSCDAVNLFCEAIESNQSNSTDTDLDIVSGSRHSLSPAVAGVIGAIVALAVCIIAGISLCLFGFRINYRERDPKSSAGGLGVLRRSGSGNGGFKGAEKLASDTDLHLKGGAGATVVRHERVGSWELNGGPKGDGKHSSLDKEIESGRVTSYRRSEDGIEHDNPFGDPVKPLDQV